MGARSAHKMGGASAWQGGPGGCKAAQVRACQRHHGMLSPNPRHDAALCGLCCTPLPSAQCPVPMPPPPPSLSHHVAVEHKHVVTAPAQPCRPLQQAGVDVAGLHRGGSERHRSGKSGGWQQRQGAGNAGCELQTLG